MGSKATGFDRGTQGLAAVSVLRVKPGKTGREERDGPHRGHPPCARYTLGLAYIITSIPHSLSARNHRPTLQMRKLRPGG